MTSIPVAPGEAVDLHAAIMNLPCTKGSNATGLNHIGAYKIGHRDARHAAAELAASSIQSLREDAERYRWLRESDWFMFEQRWLDEMPGYASARGEDALHAVLDAAIDAARKEGK